jgi:hypothetical protein
MIVCSLNSIITTGSIPFTFRQRGAGRTDFARRQAAALVCGRTAPRSVTAASEEKGAGFFHSDASKKSRTSRRSSK